MGMKLLYIEDELTIAKPVVSVLESKGYMVDFSEEGNDGLEKALVNNYDCIILDLNLPGIDGIKIAKTIRKRGMVTPILMVTARTALDAKLQGFNTGTDDYLTKPFEILELIARVEALIRRKSVNNSTNLKFGSYEFFPDKNLLTKSNGEQEKNKILLSNKESGMLEYLVRNKGKVVSQEEFLEHVWDSNVDMFTETVKTHIKTLRKKLGKEAELIQTIKGKGYIYE